MTKELFGTSGIRGIFNKKITPKLAINLSKSFATELGESGEILIGRDARVSGKTIENALIGGFLSTGYEVKTLGIVPTPVVAFSVPELEADGGVMITASHNPPEYNGLKLFNDAGMALPPKREKEIENTYYNNREFNHSTWDKIGKTTTKKPLKNYLNQMKQQISLKKEHKIIIDCANGPTSRTTPHLLEELGCEVITINSQLDGTFPGHPAEPVEENLQDLSNLINTTDADLGFAHDGDGDRIAVVDENSRVVNQDKLLALMGSYSVERFGKGVVTTVDASKIVDEQVSEAGGEVIRTKVGDVSVVQEMKSRGFRFGGEPSGTWIIGDIHMCPDGTLAAARILEMLENRNEKLSQLVDSTPSYPILRAKIDCPNEEKQEKMKKVKENAPKSFEKVENMLTIDGVRLEFGEGDWILIRPSGTEPYIRITTEASDREHAEALIRTAKNLLEKA